MLMTGRTLFHLENRGANIPEDHVMMPEVFQKAGYRTFGTGKWHNGRRAFTGCFTQGGKIMYGGMSDHLKVPVYDFDPTGEYPAESQFVGDKFSSELFTDEAVAFLEKHPSDMPFFLYVSYTAPHDPRMAPEDFTQMYPPEKVQMPENFMPRHPFDNGEMRVRDEALAPWPRTPEIIREHIAAYYAMISHLDDQIGRILDTLERRGMTDNTIIVLAGDNGLAVGQHGLLGKQNLYDHSVRVPLVLCGPGIPKDRKSNALCYVLDIFPTLCEMLGLPMPETNEGISLYPIIKRRQKKIRDSLFLAYTKLQRGVRTDDDWKLIRYNVKGVQTAQLFNLRNDPHEMNNLASDDRNGPRLQALTILLSQHMQNLDDFCDLEKPNWGLPKEVYEKKTIVHLAVGKELSKQNAAVIQYNEHGLKALTDGIRGISDFKDGGWIGIEGDDLDVVIDLGSLHRITKITVGCLEDQGSWIFYPTSMEFALSKYGVSFESRKRLVNGKTKKNHFKMIQDFSETFGQNEARFIRVFARNLDTCPEWHQGAGGKAWIFFDEIMVE